MAIPALIGAVLPFIGDVLDRVIPDKEAAAKAKRDIEATLVQNAAQINLAQIELNKEEAQHKSVFVAGWRPAIGWTCAAGLFWTFLGHPVAEWGLLLSGRTDVDLPTIDSGLLLELVLAMLGLGGLRTFEKLKGVASENLTRSR